MQTKHLCFLIHIWTKGEVGAPWNQFKPSSKIFFQGCASFVDHLCYFCLVFIMLSWVSVYWCLVVTCWERANLLALVCEVVTNFPIGILGQVWCLIVLIPDLCPFSYFEAGVEVVLSWGTRQFTDKTFHRHDFEDSSPTDLKTVHRQNWRQFIDTILWRYWHMVRKYNWLLWRNIDELWFEVICWYNLLRKWYFVCLIND